MHLHPPPESLSLYDLICVQDTLCFSGYSFQPIATAQMLMLNYWKCGGK